jgi:hypothetical protein
VLKSVLRASEGIAGIIAFRQILWFCGRRTGSATGIWSSLTACGGTGIMQLSTRENIVVVVSTCGCSRVADSSSRNVVNAYPRAQVTGTNRHE